ncbi:hypothetical protein J4403_03505 [Candidatus Woesearchaeota archaeon]|nr:hypothetical protein [uncultured archaeon]MBS3167247.1 hypothetical protein [Candidatus Woesearchaeota archaeon]
MNKGLILLTLVITSISLFGILTVSQLGSVTGMVVGDLEPTDSNILVIALILGGLLGSVYAGNYVYSLMSTDELDEQLDIYTSQALDSGYSKEFVTFKLLNAGWPKEKISNSFKRVKLL